MKQKELEKIAQSLSKDIKTEADLSKLSSQLMKVTVEAAFGAELRIIYVMGSIKKAKTQTPVTASPKRN